jgi:hypothetical protein
MTVRAVVDGEKKKEVDYPKENSFTTTTSFVVKGADLKAAATKWNPPQG